MATSDLVQTLDFFGQLIVKIEYFQGHRIPLPFQEITSNVVKRRELHIGIEEGRKLNESADKFLGPAGLANREGRIDNVDKMGNLCLSVEFFSRFWKLYVKQFFEAGWCLT